VRRGRVVHSTKISTGAADHAPRQAPRVAWMRRLGLRSPTSPIQVNTAAASVGIIVTVTTIAWIVSRLNRHPDHPPE